MALPKGKTSGVNPSVDGLQAIAGYGSPDGDEMLLIRGVESATGSIRRGHAVSAHAYGTYTRLIARVEALRDALEQRVKIQVGAEETADEDR